MMHCQQGQVMPDLFLSGHSHTYQRYTRRVALAGTRGDDEALKSFRTAWELARKRAKLQDVRFHDLRSEYASRLVEKGVPLSQVRDLLGHCSIVVTERYDRQVLSTLKDAAGKLDDGQPFKNLSRSDDQSTPVESVSSTH